MEIRMKTGKVAPPKKVTPLRVYGSSEFAQTDFPLVWLVDGVFVAKQPAVIGGPPKSLKTTIAVDLAISLGTRTPFLGKFRVPKKVRVAVLSGESGGTALQETAKRICKAKRVSLDNCGVDWVLQVPRLDSKEGREQLRTLITERKIDVVIIDPLYLCLLSAGAGGIATNLFEMGHVLKSAARVCLKAGATPILVHHAVKSADGKTEHVGLGDLAFAGIAEYVRQWLLLGHRVPFVPGEGAHDLVMTIGGSVGHADRWRLMINEGALATDFTGRKWDVALTKDDIDKPKKERGKKASSDEYPRSNF
jgi:hypothetical protein